MSKKAEAEIERARLAATVEAARCAKESLQQWPTVSELMVAARSVNGSAPLPTDPQGRQRLLDQATDFWQDARAYLDARKRAAQWEAEEAKRLAEETHWRSQLDLSNALFYLANPDDPFAKAAIQKIIADSGMGAMKFAAFINKITGSGRTVDNMARVRKWLEWCDPAADIGEEMEKLRKQAASEFAPLQAETHAESFAKWSVANRSAVARENAKKPNREKKGFSEDQGARK